MAITAIETEYAGCRFRSRTEARWAVLMDRLNIPWEYEPQGWEMPDGSRYLPDFWLPRHLINVEVKGSDDQLARDMPKMRAFVQASNALILILGQVPRVDHHVPVHPVLGMCDGEFTSLASVFLLNSLSGRWDVVRLLSPLPVTVEPTHLGGLSVSRQLLNAYYVARSARFEHGETPSPRDPEAVS